MKKLILITACLLAAVIAFGACGKKDVVPEVPTDFENEETAAETLPETVATPAEETADEKDLAGNWKCELDLAEQFNGELAQGEFPDLGVDSFKVNLLLEITDDTLTMNSEVDEASVDGFVDALLAYAKSTFPPEALTGLDDEKLKEMMDVENLKTTMTSGFDSAVEEKMTNYTVEGSRIVSVIDGVADESDYVEFTLDGDTLTFTAIPGFEGDEYIKLPFIFHRV